MNSSMSNEEIRNQYEKLAGHPFIREHEEDAGLNDKDLFYTVVLVALCFVLIGLLI